MSKYRTGLLRGTSAFTYLVVGMLGKKEFSWQLDFGCSTAEVGEEPKNEPVEAQTKHFNKAVCILTCTSLQ